jgi:hypothetical protein
MLRNIPYDKFRTRNSQACICLSFPWKHQVCWRACRRNLQDSFINAVVKTHILRLASKSILHNYFLVFKHFSQHSKLVLHTNQARNIVCRRFVLVLIAIHELLLDHLWVTDNTNAAITSSLRLRALTASVLVVTFGFRTIPEFAGKSGSFSKACPYWELLLSPIKGRAQTKISESCVVVVVLATQPEKVQPRRHGIMSG